MLLKGFTLYLYSFNISVNNLVIFHLMVRQ